MICLDTSVLIDYFRKKNKEQTLFYQLASMSDRISVTAITTFEIFKGSTPSQHTFWEDLFAKIKVLALNEDSSRIAAQLHRSLVSRNKVIDLPDLLIAAIAIDNKLPIATLNKKDFERIPHLRIVSEFPTR